MQRNIETWQRDVVMAGTQLRPHVKTHKSVDIAALQRTAGATGITVAKTAEAEVFVGAGFDDVVVAYPVVGEEKWLRLAALAADGTRIGVNVDGEIGARGLSGACEQLDATIEVYLDVDSGFHRGGIESSDAEGLRRLGELVTRLPGLSLVGVTTHRNVFFEGAAGMSNHDAGVDEGELMVAVAEALRSSGLDVPQVTGGGTVTGRAMATVSGVTEVRAGTYVFQDLMQLELGAAEPDQLALSVLCTVVSRRKDGAMTVDAGLKTFSGDQGLSNRASAQPIARAVNGGAVLERLTEEHGLGRAGDEDISVGDRVAFHPTHACTAVNLADELFGVRDGVVEHVWPVSARGART
jgi:D-serine deaminase-like pyridoxal phosphate-dependent protein